MDKKEELGPYRINMYEEPTETLADRLYRKAQEVKDGKKQADKILEEQLEEFLLKKIISSVQETGSLHYMIDWDDLDTRYRVLQNANDLSSIFAAKYGLVCDTGGLYISVVVPIPVNPAQVQNVESKQRRWYFLWLIKT